MESIEKWEAYFMNYLREMRRCKHVQNDIVE